MEEVLGSNLQRSQVGSRGLEIGSQTGNKREKYEDMEPDWPIHL
jgi:hypothetical protein